MGPEVASGGTTAVMRRSRLFVGAMVKLAEAPLKRTAVAPVKLVPVRVIFAPGVPVDGVESAPVKPGGGAGYQERVKAPACAALNALLLATETL